MRLMRLLPRHISAQMAALMLFAVIVFNAFMTSVLILLPHVFEPPALRQAYVPVPPVADQPSGAVPPSAREATEQLPARHPPLFGPGPLLATFLYLVISVSTLGVWATHALIIPLKKFATAAEQFRAGGGVSRLDETGPTEIRSLARALNEMQTRISDLVAERTRMLAAIGHDLRTPITRLRLRAEFLPSPTDQSRMLADLDHMEALVRSALLHLQEGRTGEGFVAADLTSLLQTIVDQFGDLGSEIAFEPPSQAIARIKPHEIRRAVTNLVENAVRYGQEPSIALKVGAEGSLDILVEDCGAGLPDEAKRALMEPFARGDAARSMNAFEGFGLGLAIARQIAEVHGGRLELRDRSPVGLSAVIVLPKEAVVMFEG